MKKLEFIAGSILYLLVILSLFYFNYSFIQNDKITVLFNIVIIIFSVIIGIRAVYKFNYINKKELNDVNSAVRTINELLTLIDRLDNRLLQLKQNNNDLESEKIYLESIRTKINLLYRRALVSFDKLSLSESSENKQKFSLKYLIQEIKTQIISCIDYCKSTFNNLSPADKNIFNAAIITYIISFVLGNLSFNGFISLLFFVISIILILYLVLKPEFNKTYFKSIKVFDSKKEMILFSLVLSIGIFFRFYLLDTIPYGLWLDEIEVTRKALEIATNHHYNVGLFKTSPMIHENWVVFNNIYLYYVLILFNLFGVTLFAVKLISILPAIGCIIGSFFLFRFISNNFYTALITMLILSVSHWAVTIDRWGWNEVFLTMLQVFAYLFILMGIRDNNKKYLFIGGMTLGLAFYTYVSFNIVVLITLLTLATIFLFDFKSIKRYMANSLIVLVAAFIIISPGLISYIIKPSSYFVRMNEAFISHQITQDKSIAPLFRSLNGYIKMFHVQGDLNTRHNTNKQPQLDIISGLFFLIGFGLCLIKIRQKFVPFLFIWLILGLAGGVLTNYEGSPNVYRTALIIPVVMFFVAYGLKLIIDIIKYLTNRSFAVTISALILACIIILNFNIYFIDRPAVADNYYSTMNPDDVIIAENLNKLIKDNPDLPVYLDGALTVRSYTIDVLNTELNGVKKYRILENAPYNLFKLNKEPFGVVFDPTNYALFTTLFRRPDIKKIINPLGITIGYVAKVDKTNIYEKPNGKIISSFDDEVKTLCGSFVNSLSERPLLDDENQFINNVVFKRTEEDIDLTINTYKIFNENNNEVETYLDPNQISYMKLCSRCDVDKALENIWIKEKNADEFVLLKDAFKISNYTDFIGLKASYYDNPNWEGIPVKERFVQSFDDEFNYRNKYSIKFEGFLKVDKAGDHQVKAISDNEYYLTINGEDVLSRENNQNTVNLKEGFHPFVLKLNNYKNPKGISIYLEHCDNRFIDKKEFYNFYYKNEPEYCI